MCMKVNDYQSDLKQYCEKNNLSYLKLASSIKGCGSNDVLFQIPVNGSTNKGLLDETPMPTVLIMRKTNSGLEFEQTEHTKKYLAL